MADRPESEQLDPVVAAAAAPAAADQSQSEVAVDAQLDAAPAPATDAEPAVAAPAAAPAPAAAEPAIVEDGEDAIPLKELHLTSRPHDAKDEKHSFEVDEALPMQPEEEATEEEKKSDEKQVSYFTLYRYANFWDYLFMFLGTIGAVAAGISLPYMTVIFGNIIDVFTNFVINPDDSNADYLRSNVAYYCIYFCVLGVINFGASYATMCFWMLSGERQTHKIRKAFFTSLVRQNIGWFDKQASGDLTTRLSADLVVVSDGISEKVGFCLQHLATFFAGFVIAYIRNWRLALVLCAVFPLLAVAGAVMGKVLSQSTTGGQDAYGEAGALAQEVIASIRTVTAFSNQQFEADRYEKLVNKAARDGFKKAHATGLGIGTMFGLMFATYSLAFWYGSLLIYWRISTVGQVLNCFFAIIIGAFSVSNASPNVNAMGSAAGAASKIFNIIDRASEIDPLSEDGVKPEKFASESITFKNVRFSYPTRPDITVLEDFSLKIAAGTTTALVGDSGCGKSTVVGILERFYDPSSGSVEIDGVDIKTLNVEFLRRSIGIVGQEAVLFDTTIAENIKLGGKDITQAQVEEACRLANAEEFILRLPDRYNTKVGERGSLLSGGQKQRIAIARALVRNPKILLLDEATSALDSESEKLVQEALDRASAGRTTIMIAHRLSTVKNANNIVVMTRGGIILEQGTHTSLLDQGGRYAELVKAQNLKSESEKDSDKDSSDDSDDSDVAGSEKKASLRNSSKHEKDHNASTRASTKRSQSKKGDVELGLDEDEVAKPAPPLARIFRMNMQEWPYLVTGLFGAATNGLVMPLFSVIFSGVINDFATPDLDQMRARANFWAGMFLVLAVACFLANYFQMGMFMLSGELLTARLRAMSFRAMLRQEIGYFEHESRGTGALTAKLATDAELVKGLTGQMLGSMVQMTSNILCGLIIAFVNGWKLSLVVLACLPLIGFAGYLQMSVLTGNAAGAKSAFEEASAIANEALSSIRTISMLSLEKHFMDKYFEMINGPFVAGVRKAWLSSIGYGLGQALLFYCYALVFWYGAELMINDNYSYSNMLKVMFSIMFSGMAIGQITTFAPNVSKAKLAAAEIWAILDRVPKIQDPAPHDRVKLESVKGNVGFSGVTFAYPNAPEQLVLRGLDVQAAHGKTVSLVGHSGCGKSTTVGLLLRFYDVKSGSVTLDGVDIRNMNMDDLRYQIGIVSQEPALFRRSIRENIAYGKPFGRATEEEIVEAAKLANIYDFVMSLPMKFDTAVGERGTQLSGGQKQRVAIARALVRNPKILLLDEATSALDNKSERVVQAALDKASVGRTTIVIAHRLSTIQNSDTINVIRNGQVAESGTHNQLLNKRGEYYELVQKQSLSRTA